MLHAHTAVSDPSLIILCRVPTFLGSLENVYELDQFYKYYSGETTDGSEVDDE